MLKIKDVFSKTKLLYNESDYHLKIKVLFEEYFNNICYWSASGTTGSLIEIGLERSTGLILEITTVVTPIIYQQELIIPNTNIMKQIGLPLFETSLWKPKMNPLEYHVEFNEPVYNIEENCNFEIYAGVKDTIILFSSNNILLNVINDPVIFGFDNDNNLCYIHFQNMALNDEGFLEAV